MLIDGINLPRTSVISGMTLERLDNFPTDPVKGQSFFLTQTVGDADPGQYTYTGIEWSAGSGGNPYSDAKESVRVATTDPIGQLNGLKTIDGIALQDKDRVLVKNQADARQNGIWQVVASGNWIRVKDANNNKGVTSGMYTFVTEGAANAGTGWVLNTPDPINVEVTELNFSQFSGTGNISAGTGLQRLGNSFSLIPTGVTPAVYRSVSIDAYGRVTAGSNPTTLSGYGITDAQSAITGAASSITSNNLNSNRIVATDANGKITQHTVTVTDLANMKTVTDAVQGQLDAKQAVITGAASSVVATNLTPNVLVGTDANGKLTASSAALADVNQLSGVKSNVQTQIDSKINKAGDTLTGPLQISTLPTDPKHLANKQYVDQQVSSLSAQPRSIFATVPGDVMPFVGTLRWYPPFPIIVSGCRIFQGTPPTITPTQVDVKKNGAASVFAGAKPTINTSANVSTLVGSNVTLTTDDYLTIDVVQGSGQDLSIRVDYTTA